jgi:hypothetical protein
MITPEVLTTAIGFGTILILGSLVSLLMFVYNKNHTDGSYELNRVKSKLKAERLQAEQKLLEAPKN